MTGEWNNNQAPGGEPTPGNGTAGSAAGVAEPVDVNASAASSSSSSWANTAAGTASANGAAGAYGPIGGTHANGSAGAAGANGTAAGTAGWAPGAAGPGAGYGAGGPGHGWTAVPGAGYAPYGAGPRAAQPAGETNPKAAFWLGLIPGVGAMYNGQVAKGFVHLGVFVLLVALSDHIDVFGFFVAGWIFYQAFEAYQTARARREGLPLPNAFGWNDIGERMGFGKNWAPVTSRPMTNPAPPPPGAYTPGTYPAGAYGKTAPPPPPASAAQAAQDPYAHMGPNWAGYVPPSVFGGPAASAPAPGMSSAAASDPASAGQGVPFVPVNAGGAFAAATPTGSRFPVGAFWLIGLGLLFLLGQWTPLVHLGHDWMASIGLAGLAVWIFLKRMGLTGHSATPFAAGLAPGVRLACAARFPGLLLTVAVLVGLQQAHLVYMDRSWPWLLIVGGALLVWERTARRDSTPGASQATGTWPDGGFGSGGF